MAIKEMSQEENALNLDEKIAGIFDSYLNVIAPFVVQIEVLDREYPVEILNEIRAIFTHLARSSTTTSKQIYEENIIKAERHIKRAVLDCFKYLCISYEDHFKEFEKMYEGVDLSFVDNGEFLPELCRKRKKAVELIQAAKKKELSTEDVESIFPDYEDAFNAYADVYNMINNSYDKFENLKIKAVKKERWRTILDICGVIGTIFGIVGVVLAIISM